MPTLTHDQFAILETATIPTAKDRMYLEISFEDEVLLELPTRLAANLEFYLNLLAIKYDEKFEISEDFDEPGEWYTELEIIAVYY